jgi:hypothetical protein
MNRLNSQTEPEKRVVGILYLIPLRPYAVVVFCWENITRNFAKNKVTRVHLKEAKQTVLGVACGEDQSVSLPIKFLGSEKLSLPIYVIEMLPIKLANKPC